MKKIKALLISLFLLVVLTLVHGSIPQNDDGNNTRTSPFKAVSEAFFPGEKIEYQVSWLGVVAGKSYMSVDHPEKIGDRTVWPLRSGAETSGLVKRLYHIDNKTVSFLSPLFCYPLRFEVEQATGKQEELITLIFHQKNQRVEWFHTYKGKKSEGTDDISRGVQDSLSSIYYLRNVGLSENDSVKIPIYASQKRWMLQANVIKKEKIKVPAGTFMTLNVKPIMLPESEGKPKGTMELWFTDDVNHIPVRVSSEVAIGSVVMEMTSFKPGTRPADYQPQIDLEASVTEKKDPDTD